MSENHSRLPLILEPEQVPLDTDSQLAIVDLSKTSTYAQYHIPGAIHLEYGSIVRNEKPIGGLLPTAETLSGVLSALGLSPQTHVIAYDDEGGGKAARLLWTLETVGHTAYSLLNGGLHAWANEGHPLDNSPVRVNQGHYPVKFSGCGVADNLYIQQHLKDPQITLLDTRSKEEFDGSKKFSARGGHIPGAQHLDWLETMDRQRNLRLLPSEQLLALLSERGISERDQQIIVYCQTHHRSSHTFVMLKSLGFTQLRGYPGAWSEWGNDPQLPVEG